MRQKRDSSVRVGFVALGCPKNVVDSERMLAEIVQAGFLITAEPADADVVVINTCGFIEPAKAEALEAIKYAVACKSKGSVRKVIVAGCLPERLGAEMFEQAQGVDAVVGLGQRDNIAEIIEKTLESDKSTTYLTEGANPISDDRVRLRIGPEHWAYLRISEGCNHKCSFCTIPAIRGKFRSKPEEMILSEAAELAAAGSVELNIIGQDTTCYGRDLKIKDGLAKLLVELEKIEGPKWIRLMYLYPAGITNKLIDTIAASEKILHYADIPIQHINNEILKDMRRPDTKERICGLIEKMRSAIDNLVLRTTVIAGFPGETDEQFGELLKFVRWAKFDALGCFKYYPESGTAAAKMNNQVPEHIKQERVNELMLAQQEIAFEKNRNRFGSKLKCLVDSVDDNAMGRGRFYGQAPEIDSVCIIKNCSADTGQFVNTKVVGSKDYDLVVEQI